MEKHSVSRLSYLFAHLYLLSSYSFSSDLLSSNLPLLSASALLCFSSLHIVGSLTSKLPSIIYTVYHSSFPVFAILGLRVVSSRPASDYGKLRFRRRPQTAGPAVWDTTLQRKSSHHVSPIFNIYQTQKWVQFLTTPVTFTTEGKAYEPCCQILLVVLGCLGSSGTMNEKLIEKTGAPKGTSGQHLRAP